jgi:hypothetical protein
VDFELDQNGNSVFLGEAIGQIVLVLPYALNKIRCYAHVKRSVPTAGKDVDAGLLYRCRLADSDLRGIASRKMLRNVEPCKAGRHSIEKRNPANAAHRGTCARRSLCIDLKQSRAITSANDYPPEKLRQELPIQRISPTRLDIRCNAASQAKCQCH